MSATGYDKAKTKLTHLVYAIPGMSDNSSLIVDRPTNILQLLARIHFPAGHFQLLVGLRMAPSRLVFVSLFDGVGNVHWYFGALDR